MDTAPDPLDLVWTSADRDAARERCRVAARASAMASAPQFAAAGLSDASLQEYASDTERAWLKVFDADIARAAEIMRSPEAVGREALARRLVTDTKHSADAALIILRRAGSGVALLPAGSARTERLASMRRLANLEASA